MDDWCVDIDEICNLNELKNCLSKIFKTENNDESLAKCLDMSKSTMSRIFSPKINFNYKEGPEIANAEKIVKAIMDFTKNDEDIVRNTIYKVLYNPEIFQEKLDEYKKRKEIQLGKIAGVGVEEKKKEKDIILKRMGDVIKKILKERDFNIDNCFISKKFEIGVIYNISPEYNHIYLEVDFDKILGIYLTEANYTITIHDIAELNTDDGIIILFYEDENVFDKAWRDDKLEVENNLLLYCLSRNRKIYVKSTREDQDEAIENLFGEDILLFPHK